MPHDMNGHELKVGDEVTLRLEVIQVNELPEGCNLTLRAVNHDVYPQSYLPVVSCNARLTRWLDRWTRAFKGG